MTTALPGAKAQDFPTIIRNEFNPTPRAFTCLPFVADIKIAPRKKERSFWAVPEVSCYATANVVGAQYAADWIQYLKQNPQWVGAATTGHIARDMCRTSPTASRGIEVGFWA